MSFMHILGQKEATWNTIFSIFERRRGPPNIAGPGKTFPPFPPPLDGPDQAITFPVDLQHKFVGKFQEIVMVIYSSLNIQSAFSR